MKSQRNRNVLNKQAGLAMLEYVWVLGLLLAVFVMLGIILQRLAIIKGSRAGQAISNAVPYDPALPQNNSPQAQNILKPEESY